MNDRLRPVPMETRVSALTGFRQEKSRGFYPGKIEGLIKRDSLLLATRHSISQQVIRKNNLARYSLTYIGENMRYILISSLLAAGLMSCSSDQSPKVEIENCIPPPTPTIPPIGIFNSKSVNGTVYFAYSTCGLDIYTKNSETFKAEQVSKISIKINQSEIVVQEFTKPIDLNALSIRIKASLLTDYIGVFNSLRNGKASFVIYSSEAIYGEVATLICGNKECGT